MPDPLNLFYSIVFGIIGVAYVKYGKGRSFFFILFGLLLIMFTIFVTDTMHMVYTGIGLTIAPFILRKIFSD